MVSYFITTQSGVRYEVQVDAVDAAEYERSHWHVQGGYAARNVTLPNGHRVIQLLHRQLLGLVPLDSTDIKVDHKNNDKVDNRRANLRLCTCSENSCNRAKQSNNRSGIKGVCWDKSHRRWIAYCGTGVPGCNRHIGRFVDLIDAIRARLTTARAVHGAFLHSSEQACLNRVAVLPR